MAFDNKTLNGDVGEQVTIEVGTSLNATQRASTGEFSENVTVTRTAPNTRHDMYEMHKWKRGDKLYGTFAKKSPAWQRYRDDVNRDWGKEKDYKSIYINTLSDKKVVSDQLEDFDNL